MRSLKFGILHIHCLLKTGTVRPIFMFLPIHRPGHNMLEPAFLLLINERKTYPLIYQDIFQGS